MRDRLEAQENSHEQQVDLNLEEDAIYPELMYLHGINIELVP